MNAVLDNEIARDNEGYLQDPLDWNRGVAESLAAEEGITLDAQYWSVFDFMRQYWTDHRIAPDVRHVVSNLAQEQDIEKKIAKKRLFAMFPYGYVKQACKIAGMQRPRAWSTG